MTEIALTLLNDTNAKKNSASNKNVPVSHKSLGKPAHAQHSSPRSLPSSPVMFFLTTFSQQKKTRASRWVLTLTGVRIRGALAVDAPTYLKGLWAVCRALVNKGSTSSSSSSSRNANSGGDGDDSAMWVRRDVKDIHALAASGEFNAVVACVGAGVRVLAGVKDIVSLRFVRGQSLLYNNVRTQEAAEAAEEEEGRGARAGGNGEKMLQSAVLCGQYVVPSTVDETGAAGGNGGKILLGATQEYVMSGQKVRTNTRTAWIII